MKSEKFSRDRVQPSEVLDPIIQLDCEIKTIKHGNTGLILYRYPSKTHNWENCWTDNIQTAKTGIAKYSQHMNKIKKIK